MTLAIMMIISLAGLQIVPPGVSSSTEDYPYGWAAPGPGDTQIPVYQCGLCAGVYVLNYFHITCKCAQLMSFMSPIAGGIPLSDLVRALRLHGLEVSPRGGVGVNELKESLSRELIGVLPTGAINQRGHYYVVVPGANSPFLLVDAGRSVSPCSKEQMIEYLSRNGGVVTFVQRRKDQQDATETVLEPTEYDLGQFHYPTDKTIAAKFTLRNSASRPILIKDVMTPCSCMTSECVGTVLESKGRMEVSISVQPGGWGHGQKTKSIVFRFGDDSTVKVQIKGQCLDAFGAQGIGVLPTEIFLDVDGTYARRGGGISREVRVYGDVSRVQVGHEGEWLSTAFLDSRDPNERIIQVTAFPEKAGPSDDAAVAGLRIWTKDDAPAVHVPIRLVRRRPYRVVPRIASLSRQGKGGQVLFDFVSTQTDKGKVQLLSASSPAQGVRLEYQRVTNMEEGQMRVSLMEEDTKPGVVPIDVTLSVETQSGREEYEERVLVLVR